MDASQKQRVRGIVTFLRLCGGFARKTGFLERSPFEVFLVASTWHIPPTALLARRLGLVAFQPLRLAGNAACKADVRASARSAAYDMDAGMRELHTVAAFRLFGFADAGRGCCILGRSGRFGRRGRGTLRGRLGGLGAGCIEGRRV